MRCASSAVIISPVRQSSCATPLPQSRASRCDPPYPGRIPSFTSGCPSFAVLLAIRMVQESASSQPPPSANPLIAQIEGFPIVSRRWKTPWPKSENSLPLTGVCSASSLISAPATNAFSPAPVRISTRTAWSSRASSSACCNSSTVLRFSAFSTFGRLNVMYAIPSFFSYSMFSKPISSLLSALRFLAHSASPRYLFPSPLKFHRPRIPRIGVIIKPPSRLPPVPSRQHHALQQRRSRESPLLELLKHNLRNVIGRVEPHEIQQCQRPHRVTAAQLHRIINILNRPDAFFQRANRIHQIRHQQPVDDEARAVMCAHRSLAELRPKRHHLFVNRRLRRNRPHHLDQLHHRYGIEEA